MRALAAAFALAIPSAVVAQAAIDTVIPEMRIVEGKVQLGRRAGPEPLPGLWVVVHRIASLDSGKVEGGPLDSARTDAAGGYRIRYRHYGDSRATYIAITSYAGISYITSPLSVSRVGGEDAWIMVFDTTSAPYPIQVAGRHFVITSPDADDRRRVIEVYELTNDSTLTLVGTEAKPGWRAPLPAGVKDLQLNPAGDISSETAKQVGDWLHVFSPISPGLRQLSFTYTLPASAFPLSLPMLDSLAVFEVLVQEPGAVVEGGGLAEVEGVVQEGVSFRRLLARSVRANSVVRFTMPKSSSRFAKKGVLIVAGVLGASMALALGFALWRRRRQGVAPRPLVDPVDDLVRDLAALDADFERRAESSDAERAEFDQQRTALKLRLSAALAARRGAS